MISHLVQVRVKRPVETVPLFVSDAAAARAKFVALVPDFPSVKAFGVTREEAAQAAIDQATNIIVACNDLDNPAGPHAFEWQRMATV